MINIKEIIAKEIEKVTKLNSNELESYIEKPKEAKMEIMHFHVLDLQRS